MTSEHPECNPNSTIFAGQENAMINWKGEIKTRKKSDRKVLSVKVPLPSQPTKVRQVPIPPIIGDDFTSSLLDNVNISSIISSKRKGISPENLTDK